MKVNFDYTSSEDIMKVLHYEKTSVGKWKKVSAFNNRFKRIFPASLPKETVYDEVRRFKYLTEKK